MLSTKPAKPKMIPDCMQCLVFLPITVFGASSSIIGSCAVFDTKPSSEVLIPGAIITPISSLLAPITSKVVAVPKSITTIGPPYLVKAETLFTIMSAPTSLGLSALMFKPVFTPGPIIKGVMLKKYSHMWQMV